MTNSQIKAIKSIERLVESYCKSMDLEVKRFETRECEYFISVSIVMGRPNDEGTMAFMIRDYAQLFIGKRGGITYPMTNKGGKYCRKKFKGYSILQAVCDQKR